MFGPSQITIDLGGNNFVWEIQVDLYWNRLLIKLHEQRQPQSIRYSEK